MFLGTTQMMFSQNNKDKNSDMELSNLNVELLNNMLAEFAEKNKSETKYYPGFFQISEGALIKNSDTNTEWKYGNWTISKVVDRKWIIPEKGISLNEDDVLLMISADSVDRTDEIEFDIWFTPKKQKYQIITDMITTGRIAPVPIEISLRKLKSDYLEIVKSTGGIYFEVYIKNEEIENKELVQIINFLLENISDDLAQDILYNLINGEVKLPNNLLKMIFKKSDDTMRRLVCRCKDLDSELMEWCEDVEDVYR